MISVKPLLFVLAFNNVIQLSFQVVESVLDSHDNNINDAIKSLHALCLDIDFPANEATSCDVAVLSNVNVVEGQNSFLHPNSNQKIKIKIKNKRRFSWPNFDLDLNLYPLIFKMYA